MSHDVFISYSHLDRPAAEAVCAILEASNVPCWIAPRDMELGLEWAEAIHDAISKSLVTILIFSSNADKSRQVRREVELSVGNGILLLPVHIDQFKPTKSMAYFLAGVHWLEAVPPPIEQHLGKLTTSILRLPELASRHPPVQVEPPFDAISRSLRNVTSAEAPESAGDASPRKRAASSDAKSPVDSDEPPGELSKIVYRYRFPLWFIFIGGSGAAIFIFIGYIGLFGLLFINGDNSIDWRSLVAFLIAFLGGLAGLFCYILSIYVRCRNRDNKMAFLEELIFFKDRTLVSCGQTSSQPNRSGSIFGD